MDGRRCGRSSVSPRLVVNICLFEVDDLIRFCVRDYLLWLNP